MNVSLQPGVTLQWTWGLPSGLREAIGCVCIEERTALGEDEPSDGDGRGSHVGLVEQGLASFGWAGVTCVSVTYQLSPATWTDSGSWGQPKRGLLSALVD